MTFSTQTGYIYTTNCQTSVMTTWV